MRPSRGSIQAMHWLARSANGWPRVDSSQSNSAMTRGSVAMEHHIVQPVVAVHKAYRAVVFGHFGRKPGHQ